MSSGSEGVSEVYTKQFDLIKLVDAGVRKCLLLVCEILFQPSCLC